jgi:lipoprotein-releasing system ATP-binding protein
VASITLTDVGKVFAGGHVALDGVSLEIADGERLVLVGPSGSGKSTLLYAIGTLEPPSSGRITLDGVDPFSLDERALAAFRNRNVGFVFQDHCLLPQLSVLENVLAPSLVAEPRRDRRDRARQLLAAVGLEDRLEHRPAELSGGEKQRVAIARALVLEPRLLLCDEPTGNLDRRSAGAVADLLLKLHAEQQAILVVVTHSEELAARLPEIRRIEGESLEKE